jgi:uncharacterized protein HemX
MAEATQPEEPKAEETRSSLLNLVDKIAGTPAPPEGKSSSGAFLPVALIVLGAVVIGFSVLGIMLVLARRKAARLAAQVRKLEEEKAQSSENEKLAENAEARQVAVTATGELQAHIDELEGQLAVLSKQNKVRAAELAKISDWDDFVIVDRRAQP